LKELGYTNKYSGYFSIEYPNYGVDRYRIVPIAITPINKDRSSTLEPATLPSALDLTYEYATRRRRYYIEWML